MRRFVATICAVLFCAIPFGTAFAEGAVSLENADFLYLDTEGLPSGWYTEAWYSGSEDFLIEADEIDGHRCMCISNAAENDARLCQSIAVEGGACYRIECDILTVNVVSGAGANVSVVDSMAASEGVCGTSSGWQHVELVGVAKRDADSMAVCMRLGGYGALSSGEAWFKNFKVTKLDETPAGAVDFFMTAQAASGEAAHNVNELHGGAMLLSVLFTAVLGAICYRRYMLPRNRTIGGESCTAQAVMLLLVAFAARCALSLIFYGHSTDINCFMSWSYALAENGPAAFYNSGMFADYPPGYMYVLWFTGSIARLFGFAYGDAAYVLITKMPSILADLAAAYAVFAVAKKRCPQSGALALMCFVALNPAIAFISGAWGQIDQILALLLVGAAYLFMHDKLELAGLVYGVAIITKPQALMVGPLLMAAYFARIKDGGGRYIWRTALSVLAAVAAIFLLALPFRGDQPPLWFLDKLLGTATSYPYASIEAFNMQALLGGNWRPVTDAILGLSYGAWGTIAIAASCIASACIYIRSRKARESLVLCMALLLAAIFTFGQYMHERYVFPVLMLALAAFVIRSDKRLIVSFILYSCSLLLNTLAAFVVVENAALRGTEYQIITVLGSILSVGAFCHLALTSVDILIKKRIQPAFADKKPPEHSLFYAPVDEDAAARFTKTDRLWCAALTAVYGIVALLNLGTTVAPETTWKADIGQSATITLEREANISEVRVFGGLYEGTVTLVSDNGTEIVYTEDNNDMFRWAAISNGGFTAKSFDIRVSAGSVWLNEIAFFDENGNLVRAEASEGGTELTDEQDEIPKTPSYLNGMYFDELYHGRTAYEHLHGIDPYENSHPPLGKVFIMLGIAVFGMNAFGWRIAGVLFGIAMVPIMYAFAKRVFKKSEYALLAAGLFAFDFMHFTQTRIATIDVYGVFFIILMYYFMYKYYCLNFHVDGLKKTLRPLAVAGVFFGLGAACKWICLYAGGGLAVILFTSLGRRFAEYRRYKDSDDERAREAVSHFWRNTLLTLLWCCLFYIVVPVVIYTASYIPYVLCEKGYGLNGIWDFQKFMYSYHSGLTATHPYESAWWQWPLDLRPVWYHISYYEGEGYTSTISAFGNPTVWWVCSAGTVVLSARLMLDRIKPDKGMFVLLTGVCANYLPWVLVTRCTFAYHYFATVPFIILATVYLVRDIEESKPELWWLKWAWLGCAVLLFMLFYPVLSGVTASVGYVKALQWLPGWTFMGY